MIFQVRIKGCIVIIRERYLRTQRARLIDYVNVSWQLEMYLWWNVARGVFFYIENTKSKFNRLVECWFLIVVFLYIENTKDKVDRMCSFILWFVFVDSTCTDFVILSLILRWVKVQSPIICPTWEVIWERLQIYPLSGKYSWTDWLVNNYICFMWLFVVIVIFRHNKIHSPDAD